MRNLRMMVSCALSLASVCLLAFAGCDSYGNNRVVKADPAASVTNMEAPAESSEVLTVDGALDSVDWKSMLGKNVEIKGKLVVVDTYDLARRGQVVLARERLFVPTNAVDPNDSDASENSFEGGSNVAKVNSAQKFNERATVKLDDGSGEENVFPPALFPGLGDTYSTVRVGSTVNGVRCKVVKERGNIVLVPPGPLDWTPAERPERPDLGKPQVTVASFNVLNYFTTIDNGRNGARGADKKSEFERQEAKIVAAIVGLDADVIGLMELENNVEAENQLVAALNKKVGKEVFAGCGLPAGFASAPGGDNAIRVGIIYRSDRIKPDGAVAMINDPAFAEARVPVVQAFQPSDGKPFTLIVNHFKSKGGSDQATGANRNKGDGQGAYNAMRRSQSLAICKFIEDQSAGDANRVLVIGDLNAYAEEDPVDAMRAKGLIDLHMANAQSESSDQSQDYSYIYYGQCGSLDHAMATKELSKDVTGIATWHINCDEPRFLDYNEEYNPKELYNADPFRSSDHDPVLIGIGK